MDGAFTSIPTGDNCYFSNRMSSGAAIVTRSKTEIMEPSLYGVFLHNDDFTPMDFVVSLLESVFDLDHIKANKIMLEVHNSGVGKCGTFPYEIAETKMAAVIDRAREREYPLKCTIEKE